MDEEFTEEPWPSAEDIERQRAEFDACTTWYGYGPQQLPGMARLLELTPELIEHYR
jgi:hypothetical protein